MFKSLLLTGLLAGPMLAYNAMAASREDDHWSPSNVFTDVHGNQAAYWNDPANWGLLVVPVVVDTNAVSTFYNAAFDSAAVICVVTNDTQVGQIMCGFGGGGVLEIDHGQLQAGFSGFGDSWTGIGFVAGPGTLIVNPGADFTGAGHIWVGQNNTIGTVVVNGGTIHVPGGEFGIGWNGNPGVTNYCYVTNGGSVYMRDWSAQTLGAPQQVGSFGYMDIGANSKVVITNNALTITFGGVNAMNYVITNHQLVAFEGNGTISAVYNPAANITVLTALPPAGPTTPVFSLNPSNAVVGLGSTLNLTSAASPATGYQWMFNSVPLANGGGVSGATTANLTIANFSAAQTGIYSVVATNAAASPNDRSYTTSTSASVSADSFTLDPVITINGVNGTTYVSQSAPSVSGPWTSFSTNTAGAGPIFVIDTTSPLSTAKFYRVILP
ncbi:MAG TPA: immunoglobulin domain-containing protein [Verrucomicrobiae bacterium]|nr:immunoglobulin domain-containing protein [Verrucomicrobiae bacterium]